MGRFTVRVLLHGVKEDAEIYEDLHTAMENEGFYRWIEDNDTGTKYQLPQAEYNINSDLDRRGILAKASRAAKQTKKKFAILVTSSRGRTWVGLDEYVEKFIPSKILLAFTRKREV